MFVHHRLRRPRSQAGISLVELMVGIAIGMVVVAAMSLLFANNSRTRAETERASSKVENGRYALELLSVDLQHAGFLGSLNPRKVTLPPTKPDVCETAIATLRQAIAVPLLGVDDLAAALACTSGAKLGTDVIVVRRAAACINGQAGCAPWSPGAPLFQSSSCSESAELGGTDQANWFRLDSTDSTMTLRGRNCTSNAELRKYLIRVYFVASNDNDGDGIPTLKRAELGASGFTTVSLVHGVEDLQVEYGFDADHDGDPDVYSPNPEQYCDKLVPKVDPSPCWNSIVSAKLAVLARNLVPSGGHTESKQYVLGRKVDVATGLSNAANVRGPFGDRYKRSVFESVVRIENVSSRRATP